MRGNAAHEAQAAEHAIAPIDLLVVNLYPFEATVAKGAAFDECIENIDIGGPALIRGAAKNHASVTVVVEPGDYGRVLAEMRANGGATTLDLRRHLAAKAFARTAAYDAAISGWFASAIGDEMPEWRAFGGRRSEELRYGENPHQRAAFYAGGSARLGVATAVQHQGKELSYNNLNDTEAAFELVAELGGDAPAVAIIKHANPCGVAIGSSLKDAYLKALRCDPVSAFGGIVALNGILDAEAAEEIAKIFTEVVIAPDATDEAKTDLRRQEEPAPADGGRPARSARAGRHGALARRRFARAIARQCRRRPRRPEGRDQARADAARARRSHVRVQGGKARQVERDRLRAGTARPSASAPGR